MIKKIIIRVILILLLLIPVDIEAKSINVYDAMPYLAVDINNCEGKDNALFGDVSDPSSTAWLIQKVLNYMRVLGPTAAIVFGSLDMAKAIITSDEENMKKSQTKFIYRLLAAVALFFVPLFVKILLSLFGFTSDSALCGLQ